MNNFVSKYKAQLVFLMIVVVAIALPTEWLRSVGFYSANGHLRMPTWLYLAMYMVVIMYIFIQTTFNSKQYLFMQGYIAATAEILHITEEFPLGHPKSHAVELSMKVRVKSATTPSFETVIKTTVHERGNDALGYKVRTPDYKVGDTISVMYNPHKNNKVVIPSRQSSL